jgi:hypothetical protein
VTSSAKLIGRFAPDACVEEQFQGVVSTIMGSIRSWPTCRLA